MQKGNQYEAIQNLIKDSQSKYYSSGTKKLIKEFVSGEKNKTKIFNIICKDLENEKKHLKDTQLSYLPSINKDIKTCYQKIKYLE